MAKDCFFYFGALLFIVTFPISIPLAMYFDSKNKNDPTNTTPSSNSPDPRPPPPAPSAPPTYTTDQSENPIQFTASNPKKMTVESDEPTNL